jgi:hypothetical protein
MIARPELLHGHRAQFIGAVQRIMTSSALLRAYSHKGLRIRVLVVTVQNIRLEQRILLYVFVGAFPTYNISDLKAFTFQTFADIEAEDGRRLVRVLHGQLSRYVKENTAPPSVKGGNGRRFRRSDLDAWISAGGILAFKKVEGADANFKSIPRAEDESQIRRQRGF